MTEAIYQKRRQRVFFVLSGMFLGTLAMLNILGVTRFLDFSFTVFGATNSHDRGGRGAALSSNVHVY